MSIEHSYEAGIIAKLLDSPESIPQCDLKPDEFDSDQMRTIYEAIESVSNRGDLVTVVTVCDLLYAKTNQNWIGLVSNLMRNTQSPGDVTRYVAIVRRNNESRKARLIGETLAERAMAEGAIDNAVRELMALTLPNTRHQFEINTALKMAIDDIDARFNGERQGISTGLVDLDQRLGGLHGGDLVVIGARPAMGKTAFLLNMAISASSSGIPVGLFSGEQDIVQMTQRMIAIQGRVPIMRMRNGKMIDEDWPKLSAAVASLKDRNFITDDTPSPSLSHVVRQARSWRYGNGCGVLMIDYLQRMEVDKKQKRHESVGDNVRGLKNLARELNIPVVVLAQVNRDVEKRADKRPMMGDLADSSEVEKEADQIFMLYRDEVYNPETDRKGVAEILIEKNRHGPVGYVDAIWRGEYLRFENFLRAV